MSMLPCLSSKRPEGLEGEALKQWAGEVVAELRAWYERPELAQALREAVDEQQRVERLKRRRAAKLERKAA